MPKKPRPDTVTVAAVQPAKPAKKRVRKSRAKAPPVPPTTTAPPAAPTAAPPPPPALPPHLKLEDTVRMYKEDLSVREAIAKLRAHYKSAGPEQFASLIKALIEADTISSRERWRFTLGKEGATLQDELPQIAPVRTKKVAPPAQHSRFGRSSAAWFVDVHVRQPSTGRSERYLNLETLAEVIGALQRSPFWNEQPRIQGY